MEVNDGEPMSVLWYGLLLELLTTTSPSADLDKRRNLRISVGLRAGCSRLGLVLSCTADSRSWFVLLGVAGAALVNVSIFQSLPRK